MKALWFDGELALRESTVPRPSFGEALIRVTLAGICGTDRGILQGYSGFRGVLGHEFVGVVSVCDDVSWVGKRVVGEINITCGICDFCLGGLGRHCRNRSVVGIVNRPGVFAEYVALPVCNLHEVPPDLSDQEAVFVEPLAAAAEVLEQRPIEQGTREAVLGDGPLGLLVAQVLQHAQADVTLLGKHRWKLFMARSWGLHALNAGESNLPKAAFPVVVEATGSPSGLADALWLVEPRGTVIMKSTYREPGQFDTAKLVVDEITLLGSRCGNFDRALEFLREKRVHVQELITKTFPLESALEAFAFLKANPSLKVLISVAPEIELPR